MKRFYTFFKLCMLCAVLFSCGFTVSAQTSFYYSTGFETPVEETGWTFVNDATNGWSFGNAVARGNSNNSSLRSMYISTDNGATAGYNNAVATISMAYYTVTLPIGAKYAVAFDWRARGEANSDFLSVCLVENPADVIATGAGGVLPSWYNQTLKGTRQGSGVWSDFSFTLVGTGQPQRIVFIWQNDGNGSGSTPAGSVDNFYIRELTPVNYFCGFDDPVENAKWRLNNHVSCTNKWVIGSADYNVGPASLYISSDNGVTAGYVNREGWVTAVREFVLEAGESYDVSFDWKCYGENNMDHMYVCWVTDTTLNIGSNANSSLPNWIAPNAKNVLPERADTIQMVRSASWKTGTFKVNGTGKPARLVFFWKNNGSNIYEPGGVIDNVQLTNRCCPAPENLQADLFGTEVTLTWDGDPNGNYEVMYRNAYTDKDAAWNVLTNQTSPCQFTVTEKGRYTFWVRHICDTTNVVSDCPNVSKWSTYQDFLVVTNEGCINFVDLHSNLVQATYGPFANPYANVGVIDYGQYEETSRHTVNLDFSFDPNTNNRLQVIPPGSLASIRLGNWRTGGEAESITYTYTVDSMAYILLLKYAVVLEDPSGHGHDVMPLFALDILDSRGNVIDANCGSAEFVPGTNTAGWNTMSGGVWKDWTEVGLNLQQYVGQTIKVRLLTKDCDWSGHYGYAYFTLDCGKGSLDGVSCGDVIPDSVCAPEGFVYEWAQRIDPTNVVSTNRCFTPNRGDTAEYVVTVSYPHMSACYFQLRAYLAPQWPLADAKVKWSPDSCVNYVTFENTSVVTSTGGVLNGVKSDGYYWDLGNGSTTTDENPKVDYGPGGGKFDVMLVSHMADGECVDTLRFEIDVPPIRDSIVQVERTICTGQSVTINGKRYTETGVYSDTLISYTGCDSLIILDLRVESMFEMKDSATICEGESYELNGRMLTETGLYRDTLLTQAGCDSVVVLNLTVNPVINVQWHHMDEICEDDATFAIVYDNLGSEPTSYSVRFGTEAKVAGFADIEDVSTGTTIMIPMPGNVRAGTYDAQVDFVDDKFNCGEQSFPMRFVVNYSPLVIKQLWNDVLGLKNVSYNGGYNFVNYQWYRDGLALDGETGANYYVEGGELNFDSYYQARIIRDDGAELFTCPFRPVRLPDEINVTPITIVSQQFVVSAPSKGNVNVFNSSGTLVMVYTISDGDTPLLAPSSPGIYLVRVSLENGLSRTTKLVVVSQ